MGHYGEFPAECGASCQTNLYTAGCWCVGVMGAIHFIHLAFRAYHFYEAEQKGYSSNNTTSHCPGTTGVDNTPLRRNWKKSYIFFIFCLCFVSFSAAFLIFFQKRNLRFTFSGIATLSAWVIVISPPPFNGVHQESVLVSAMGASTIEFLVMGSMVAYLPDLVYITIVLAGKAHAITELKRDANFDGPDVGDAVGRFRMVVLGGVFLAVARGLMDAACLNSLAEVGTHVRLDSEFLATQVCARLGFSIFLVIELGVLIWFIRMPCEVTQIPGGPIGGHKPRDGGLWLVGEGMAFLLNEPAFVSAYTLIVILVSEKYQLRESVIFYYALWAGLLIKAYLTSYFQLRNLWTCEGIARDAGGVAHTTHQPHLVIDYFRHRTFGTKAEYIAEWDFLCKEVVQYLSARSLSNLFLNVMGTATDIDRMGGDAAELAMLKAQVAKWGPENVRGAGFAQQNFTTRHGFPWGMTTLERNNPLGLAVRVYYGHHIGDLSYFSLFSRPKRAAKRFSMAGLINLFGRGERIFLEGGKEGELMYAFLPLLHTPDGSSQLAPVQQTDSILGASKALIKKKLKGDWGVITGANYGTEFPSVAVLEIHLGESSREFMVELDWDVAAASTVVFAQEGYLSPAHRGNSLKEYIDSLQLPTVGLSYQFVGRGGFDAGMPLDSMTLYLRAEFGGKEVRVELFTEPYYFTEKDLQLQRRDRPSPLTLLVTSEDGLTLNNHDTVCLGPYHLAELARERFGEEVLMEVTRKDSESMQLKFAVEGLVCCGSEEASLGAPLLKKNL